jgi:hypothetical protein
MWIKQINQLVLFFFTVSIFHNEWVSQRGIYATFEKFMDVLRFSTRGLIQIIMGAIFMHICSSSL